MLLRTMLLLFTLAARLLTNAQATSQYALHYAVLINEFLPDPDPSVALPGWSFVEVKNVSGHSIDLTGWALGNGKTTATVRGEELLPPDSFLILCPLAAADAYRSFGRTAGLTGFPALAHTAGSVVLTAADGSVADAVAYDKSAFGDDVKAAGGWSLERIDAGRPCAGSANWQASDAPAGGTPGRANSRTGGLFAGTDPPQLLRAFCPDSLHVMLLFGGTIDPEGASLPRRYRLSPGSLQPVEASPAAPFFDAVSLTLPTPLAPGTIYTVSASDLTSCATAIGDDSCRAGLAEPADTGDVIFNEVLFNPPPYGADYIELLHTGRHIIDLSGLRLAGREFTGGLKDPRPVTTTPWLFFPGDFLVLTEDRAWVMKQYLVRAPGQLLGVTALPSMPDDQGDLVLLNAAGSRVDELPYDHHWHSPLLADETGVALERTSANAPTAAAATWASAAFSAGYGTPTYRNSETMPDSVATGDVSVDPGIFSPDNDGYADYCLVRCRPGLPGFTANISIYDVHGRKVKTLVENGTLGSSASFRWDGLDDGNHALPMGHYLVFTELFSLEGKIRRFRNVLVLARGRRR